MPTVADCLRQHAPAYFHTFGDTIPVGHRKVIGAITRCRTGELGGVHYRCDGCGHEHWVGRSCGNRHCPTCQTDKTIRWLEKQVDRLLPVHHFLVTFTVPQELRSVLRDHQRAGYNAIFSAASETLRAVAQRSRYLADGELGFLGVLHTWGRDPTVYHPHVHFVVPGGAVSRDRTRWLSTPANFLFPHRALSEVYRGKFLTALRQVGLVNRLPESVRQAKWVVDIKPVGNGQAVLKYLAPYIFRVAISDKRIVAGDEQSVTFRYTPSGKQRSRTRTLAGGEFVRGFLQHTLPTGFQKVRYYGWMSQNHQTRFDLVRWLVWLFLSWSFYLAGSQPTNEPIIPPKPRRCAKCGQTLRIVEVVLHDHRTLGEHALAYLDSG